MKFIIKLVFVLLVSFASLQGAQFTLSWIDNSTNEDGFRIERTPTVGVGSNVTLTRQANIRSSPVIDTTTLLGQQPTGAQGVIQTVQGGVDSTGTPIAWWFVNFASGVDGWVGHDNFSTSSTFSEIATVGTNIVTYVDAGLPNLSTYSYRVRAYNTAGNSGYSNVVTGTTPAPANTPPTVTSIANQNSNIAGVAVGPLAFTVGDIESALSSLVVTATSSNTTLFPNANIVIAGTGAARTLTLTPTNFNAGTATITVAVSDGIATATTTFTVTMVATVPAAPTGIRLTDG